MRTLNNFPIYWIDQKVHLSFSIRRYRKTRTNFLANPVSSCNVSYRHQFCIAPVPLYLIRANLIDIAHWVPDHHDKLKQVIWSFWFPSMYEIYVYITLSLTKCAIALCLKKQHTYLNQKIFYCWKILNDCNSSIKDHTTNIIIMKKFEVF